MSSSTRRSFRSAIETTYPLAPRSPTKPGGTNSPTSTLRASTVAGTGDRVTALSRAICARASRPQGRAPLDRPPRGPLGVDLPLPRAALGQLVLLPQAFELGAAGSHEP